MCTRYGDQDIFNNVGLTGWPAGYLLAEVLLHRQEMVAGHRVLELGSGIGITGEFEEPALMCSKHSTHTMLITQ